MRPLAGHMHGRRHETGTLHEWRAMPGDTALSLARAEHALVAPLPGLTRLQWQGRRGRGPVAALQLRRQHLGKISILIDV